MRISFVALGAALALAAPAAAQDPAVTVTAPDGAPVGVIGAADVAHWTQIARTSSPGLKQRPLERQALELLIQNAWVAGEAAARGIVLSEAELSAMVRAQREQAFPERADYDRFLRESGFTDADIRFRTRLEELSSRIRDEVTVAAMEAVSAADVAAEIRRVGPERTPERRDVRLVLTRTRSAAGAALRELRSGASWRTVARRRSIDAFTRNRGGLQRGVVRAPNAPAFERAVFRARTGRIEGPVKTEFGFYVFEVVRVHARKRVPVAEQRERIRMELEADAAQVAADRFIEAYRKAWRARTTCAAAFRWHHDCGNYDGTPVPRS